MRQFAFPPKKQAERLSRFAKPSQPVSSVSPQIAQIAKDLSADPGLEKIFDLIKKEATEKFANSAIGPDGEIQRTEAHYELSAIASVQARIQAFADQLKMMPEDTDDNA